MYESRRIEFVEKQLQEIDQILKGCTISNTYLERRNKILKVLAFKYMRVKFKDNLNTVTIKSRL